MERLSRFALGLAAAALAAGCTLLVSTDDLASPGAATPAAPTPEGGAARVDGGDAAATLDPFCPYPHGVSTTAAWPIRGGCVSRNGRGRVVGPTGTAKLRSFRMEVPKPTTFALYSDVAVAADGTMCIGAEDNVHGVRAYAPDGVLVWQSNTKNSFSTTIGADGALYTTSAEGVASVDATSGTTRWEMARSSEIDTSLALATNGDVYFGTYNGTVGALSKEGDERWLTKIALSSDRVFDVALGKADVLYVTSTGDTLVALDPKDGRILWKYDLGSDAVDMAAIDDAGNIYVGVDDGLLHAVDPNGARRWVADLGPGPVGTPSIARDGTIYALSERGKLRALDPNDGKERWARDLPKGIVSRQPVIDAEGTIYVVTDEPQLRVFSADGSPKFNTALPVVPRNTPSFGPNGALIMALGDGQILIFDR